MSAFRFDPKSDWLESKRSELVNSGYEISNDDDGGEIAMKWLRLQSRLIEPVRRNIWRSRGFSCEGEWSEAIGRIEVMAHRGESLTPYLSKRILDADYECFQ